MMMIYSMETLAGRMVEVSISTSSGFLSSGIKQGKRRHELVRKDFADI